LTPGVDVHVHIPPAAAAAAESADAKSGYETVVLAMGDLLGVVDAFVITSASNTRHVKTLVEEIERAVKDASDTAPLRIEGLADATWVLMDYGDFIAHVFLQETREYYDLEHLWSGAPRVAWRRGDGLDGLDGRDGADGPDLS
jgi:ribosome-associated protein